MFFTSAFSPIYPFLLVDVCSLFEFIKLLDSYIVFILSSFSLFWISSSLFFSFTFIWISWVFVVLGIKFIFLCAVLCVWFIEFVDNWRFGLKEHCWSSLFYFSILFFYISEFLFMCSIMNKSSIFKLLFLISTFTFSFSRYSLILERVFSL